MWLIDPVTKRPSVSLTVFMLGFVAALYKLLLVSGFTGTDFAAVVGSCGGVYAIRRYSDDKGDKDV